MTVTGCGAAESGAESGTETARMEDAVDLAGQYGSGQREADGRGETDDQREADGQGDADDRGQAGEQGETGSRGETQGPAGELITVAQVKTAVLDNAGLSEDAVRFVRIYLDTENGSAEYEVEFVCQNAEYDYRISALTGEILAMNCEMGNYDVDSLPPGVTQANTAPGADGQYIGSEAAKQIALGHAGLTADEVYFVHARLEQDDGSWKYDVEFHSGNTEYDYDIHASTGEILSFDQDAEYHRHGADASVSQGQITEEEARQIALAHAGVAEGDAQGLKIEYDYDHGRGEYEVEWYVGRMEYSCDVDAGTGEIFSFEKELD